MHGSHSDFNDLLEFARDLYCKDDVGLRQKWPKDYREAKKLLYDLGFADAKIYFVCLDDSHHVNWDLLNNSYSTMQILWKTRHNQILLLQYKRQNK